MEGIFGFDIIVYIASSTFVELWKNKNHNILQEHATKPFLTVQKIIQQHPRSIATLDSHDL